MHGAKLRFGRNFLRVAISFVLLSCCACEHKPVQEAQVPEVDALIKSEPLEKLAKTYNLKILATSFTFPVRITSGLIEAKNVTEREVQDYTDLFVTEFSLYPPEFVRKSKLERIVFCKELSYSGQIRTAIPNFEHNTLYIDICRASHNKQYQRNVIHHEFFHMVDFQDDHLLYEDKEWKLLNAADFKYGTGGKDSQNNSQTGVLTDKYPGFLTHYSTTGVEEDKAVMYAYLIIDNSHVERKSKRDAVVKTKVEFMKKLLNNFCSEIDDKFWSKVQAMKRL